MLTKFLASLAAAPLLATAWPHPSQDTFNNVTIFTPPATWTDRSTNYARTVLLNQNCEKEPYTLLSTWSESTEDGAYFPIYQSNDYGRSWDPLSKAYFTHGNFSGGAMLQPFLYEMAQPFGDYPAGTLLLTGNAIPADSSSTNIQLYSSFDKGSSWSYVSTVATGGPPNTTNGAPCIWEPFIQAYDNQLAVFYSDQRDPLHGQSLVYQASTDLMNWGNVVNAVAFANYTERPGMITMAQIGNGQWMATFEVGFPVDGTEQAPYASHYKIADSPLEFDAAPAVRLQATDGSISSAGPYVVWTPAGGPNGTIVVSDSTYDNLFLNTQNGDPGAWVNTTSGHGVGYTRSLRVMPGDGGKTVLLTNGGMYNSSPTEVSTGDFVVPGPYGMDIKGFASCGDESGGYGQEGWHGGHRGGKGGSWW